MRTKASYIFSLLVLFLLLMILAVTAGCGGGVDTPAAADRGALVSLSVSPSLISIAPGTTRQFSALGTYASGFKASVTSSVAWSSSNTAAADISAGGLVTAASNTGTTVISASLGGITATTVLNVVPVAAIAVTPANPSSIAPGTTLAFAAVGTLADSSVQTLTSFANWSSSDPAVAAVGDSPGSKGVATAAIPGTGSTVITATYTGVSGTATLKTSAVVSLAVSPVLTSIAKGTSLQFTTTGTLADASSQDLTTAATWAISNPLVATVSNAGGSQGRVTGVDIGTVTVTTVFSGITSSPATVEVTPAILSSLAMLPLNPIIAKGKTQQFTAIGTFTDSTTQDMTASVTWTSSNTLVSTISNTTGTNGLAASVNPGATTIRAARGAVSASTTLLVTPVALDSLLVTPAVRTIGMGGFQQFAATGIYSDGTTQDLTAQVVWSSSNAGIATISNVQGTQGLARSPGTTTGTTSITATMSGITSNTALLTVQ